MVTLSQPQPQVSVEVTATVEDDDGVPDRRCHVAVGECPLT